MRAGLFFRQFYLRFCAEGLDGCHIMDEQSDMIAEESTNGDEEDQSHDKDNGTPYTLTQIFPEGGMDEGNMER